MPLPWPITLVPAVKVVVPVLLMEANAWLLFTVTVGAVPEAVTAAADAKALAPSSARLAEVTAMVGEAVRLPMTSRVPAVTVVPPE